MPNCSSLETVNKVAMSIDFAKPLRDLAATILNSMTASGAEIFNGIHLRLVGDAMAFVADYGGEKV